MPCWWCVQSLPKSLFTRFLKATNVSIHLSEVNFSSKTFTKEIFLTLKYFFNTTCEEMQISKSEQLEYKLKDPSRCSALLVFPADHIWSHPRAVTTKRHRHRWCPFQTGTMWRLVEPDPFWRTRRFLSGSLTSVLSSSDPGDFTPYSGFSEYFNEIENWGRLGLLLCKCSVVFQSMSRVNVSNPPRQFTTL